jgi:hypothetical protein
LATVYDILRHDTVKELVEELCKQVEDLDSIAIVYARKSGKITVAWVGDAMRAYTCCQILQDDIYASIVDQGLPE